MMPRTPAILLLADKEQDESRDQFAHRYAVDYELQVAGSLSEAMALVQGLVARGTPVAMFGSTLKLSDATGLVTMQCLHALVPRAKRFIIRVCQDPWPDETLRQAQANGQVDAVLLLLSGPRDEEFHSIVTALLSDWGWTAGGPAFELVTVIAPPGDARVGVIRDFLDRQGISMGIWLPEAPHPGDGRRGRPAARLPSRPDRRTRRPGQP